MKNIIKIILVLLIFTTGKTVQGQNVPCNYTNTLNLSTGIDNYGNLLPVGTKDPNWWLINIAPPSVNGSGTPVIQTPDAYVVLNNYSTPPPSMTWNYVAGAAPISALNDANFGTNNTVGNQPWRFNRQFCVSKTSNVKLNGNFRADDGGNLLLKDANGAVLYTFANPANGINGFAYDHLFNTTLTLNPGKYFLEVELTNVQSQMMGFALNCKVSNTNTGLNSLISSSRNCCARANIISLQKIIDNNCNGTIDMGDTPGSGWTFTLTTSSGYSKTGVTNAIGELYFYDIPSGTYTLSETPQSGYNAVYPSAGSTTFTLSGDGEVKNIIFINGKNCTPPIPPNPCCKNDFSFVTPSLTPPYYAGNGFTYSLEDYNVTHANSVPITEIKVDVTSFEYISKYDDCKKCNTPQFFLGSVLPFFNVGSGANTLTQQNIATINSYTNVNEAIWQNPNGAMLTTQDKFTLLYLFPPASEIPCCVDSAKICLKISWRDVNCGYCENWTCSTVPLMNAARQNAADAHAGQGRAMQILTKEELINSLKNPDKSLTLPIAIPNKR